MRRQPEPEVMELPEEVAAYAKADFAEVNRLFVQRLVELAGQLDRADAVDLGCGPGDITIRVAQARPRWNLTAVDLSQAMLDVAVSEARRRGGSRIVFRKADAKKLPFTRHSFDVVFSNSLLHHLTDAETMWGEVARIARPRAVIFFRDLCRPPDEQTARKIVQTHAAGESELLREEFYRSLLSAYTPEEIRSQLAAAGLGHLQVSQINDRHVDIFGGR
ncbi:MAG: class I SAM-dependent methyltransferase [Phycisphaerales bacterium]|nr:class I SAM-dependent methyltransferase [Phycisphaerales bacterium]